jgi:hypothetical protein
MARQPLTTGKLTPSGLYAAGGGWGDTIICLKDGRRGFGFMGKVNGKWRALVWATQDFSTCPHDFPASDVAQCIYYNGVAMVDWQSA